MKRTAAGRCSNECGRDKALGISRTATSGCLRQPNNDFRDAVDFADSTGVSCNYGRLSEVSASIRIPADFEPHARTIMACRLRDISASNSPRRSLPAPT